jgi:hypothetical protein
MIIGSPQPKVQAKKYFSKCDNLKQQQKQYHIAYQRAREALRRDPHNRNLQSRMGYYWKMFRDYRKRWINECSKDAKAEICAIAVETARMAIPIRVNAGQKPVKQKVKIIWSGKNPQVIVAACINGYWTQEFLGGSRAMVALEGNGLAVMVEGYYRGRWQELFVATKKFDNFLYKYTDKAQLPKKHPCRYDSPCDIQGGKPVPPGRTPKCPPTMIWDPIKRRCTCPKGYDWDGRVKRCELLASKADKERLKRDVKAAYEFTWKRVNPGYRTDEAYGNLIDYIPRVKFQKTLDFLQKRFKCLHGCYSVKRSVQEMRKCTARCP